MHQIMRYLLFIVLSSLLVVLGAFAQSPDPIHTVDGEYIREWLVLGPFFPDALETDFLADSGSEANIEPTEGDTVTTSGGETLTWKRYKAKGHINVIQAILQNVAHFVGNAEQYDDMTVVVAKKV